MASLEIDYSYQILRPQGEASELAIYNQLPLGEQGQSPCMHDELKTAVFAEFELSGDHITLVLA